MNPGHPMERIPPGTDEVAPLRELGAVIDSIDFAAAGRWMHEFIRELYPICRSITGDGLRATLRAIAHQVPLEIREVPSGTSVFDWTVPKEWNIREAWVKDPSGRKVIDFARSNLQVVNYSVPVHTTMPLADLRSHLHTLPDRPDWIPYRTSYYRETWGFCLPHRELAELQEGDYEVLIDASLRDGALSYGELVLPGRRGEEILLSCHACHPSLANDNLSGIAVTTQLARLLTGIRREYTYRFLWIPGTIGAITWLALNEANASRVAHGLVVACVGDPGRFHYKKTRRGDATIDRAVVQALRDLGWDLEVRGFSPYGYDERQYGSPGFNLAVGSLTRTPHGRYPEYHTSADDLELVRGSALAESLRAYLEVFRILEEDRCYLNRNPKCEPQLGKRGLYRAIGGLADAGRQELAMLWVLNQSDGTHSLLEIAERSGLPFPAIVQAARTLRNHDLLEEAPRRGEA